MKHFKQLTLILLCFVLLLSGCGTRDTSTTNGSSKEEDNNTKIDSDEDLPVTKTEYTLNEYLNTGETIWYLTQGYGKDDEIDEILVIATDGSLYYCSSDWTLGEVEQKDDSEIVAYVKQTYEENMTKRINSIIAQEGKQEAAGTITTNLSSIYTPYLENIEAATYQLTLVSDSTGNKTTNENLCYMQFAPLSGRESDYMPFTNDIYTMTLSYVYLYESDQGSTNCFQIYDSWYGGYSIEEYKEGYHSEYFLTRVNSPMIFNLDEIGTKNIPVDVTSFSLFERTEVQVEHADDGWE